MANPEEQALVVKALLEGLSNAVEWNARAADRITSAGEFTPDHVRRRLIEHVRRYGGDCVRQRRERRERWRDHFDYVYEVVIVPYEDLKRGLYVEMRLVDDDPDVPEVEIVNTHPQLG